MTRESANEKSTTAVALWPKENIRVSERMAWHGLAYLGQRTYIVCREIIHIHEFHKSLSFFSLYHRLWQTDERTNEQTNERRLLAHSYKTIIDSKQVDWCMRFYFFLFFGCFIHVASFFLLISHHVSNTGKCYSHLDRAIGLEFGLGFLVRILGPDFPLIYVCRSRKWLMGFCFIIFPSCSTHFSSLRSIR